MTERLLSVRALGLVPYDEVWALQRETARRRISGETARQHWLIAVGFAT